MTQRLTGKVAVVTGASKGIGAEIARQLAAEGAAVVVNYASAKHDADRVVDEISKRGGKALAVRADVARRKDIEQLLASTIKAFGQLDILVNNAGIYQFEPLEAVTEEAFRRQFETNVLGPILMTQEASKHFGSGGGSVINISSIASTATPPNSVVYSATKGAVDSLTGVLAKELGPRKIRVNAINPGPVATEGYQAQGFAESDFERQAVAQTPLGRVGQPGDIGRVAVFLASADSGWVTGQTIPATGGLR